MKAITIVSALILMGMVSCNNANNGAANTEKKDTAMATAKAEPAAPKMDSAAMMKAWQDYMTPGEMHKMMASWDGKWNDEVSMWMKPDAPAQKSSSVTEHKMILGGRYQQSATKGTFNGMPFEGMSTLAYDNGKKVFISTWIDNMGTGVMTVEGPWDAASKSANMKGKCVDPTTGKEMDVREVFKIVDDKNQLVEMYMTEAGKEFKTMELKSTKM